MTGSISILNSSSVVKAIVLVTILGYAGVEPSHSISDVGVQLRDGITGSEVTELAYGWGREVRCFGHVVL